METKQVIKALSALAQESRLAMFRLLVEAGPTGMAAGKVGETLDIPAATLSFHLKELSNAELLMSRQEGRFVIYAVNYPAMTELMGFLTDNCCGGQPCATVPAASIKKRSRL